MVFSEGEEFGGMIKIMYLVWIVFSSCCPMKTWGLTEEEGGMHMSSGLHHCLRNCCCGAMGNREWPCTSVPGGCVACGHSLGPVEIRYLVITTTDITTNLWEGGVWILSPSDFCWDFGFLRGMEKMGGSHIFFNEIGFLRGMEKMGGSHIFFNGIFRALMELFQRATFLL